jgi:hypothetical protein
MRASLMASGRLQGGMQYFAKYCQTHHFIGGPLSRHVNKQFIQRFSKVLTVGHNEGTYRRDRLDPRLSQPALNATKAPARRIMQSCMPQKEFSQYIPHARPAYFSDR